MKIFKFSDFINEIRNSRDYRGPGRSGPAPFRPPIIKQRNDPTAVADQDLIDLGLAIPSANPVGDIDVDRLKPTQKDRDRADGLSFWQGSFHGNNSPWQASIDAMAKLIRDPDKMVRRAKAVVARWGTGEYDEMKYGKNGERTWDRAKPWGTFKAGLRNMGFTPEQIRKIENYTE